MWFPLIVGVGIGYAIGTPARRARIAQGARGAGREIVKAARGKDVGAFGAYGSRRARRRRSR